MGLFDIFKRTKKENDDNSISEEIKENNNSSNVESKINENNQIIFLRGDVNSNNASDIEKEIESLLDNKYKLIIDCEKLNYISSAGLRVLLRLKKSHDELRVINVNSEVYDVFDMTGFTKIMTVEKAYKVLSIDGCQVIGKGANGTVYRFDDETVIKVYRDAGDLDAIIHEREVARKALILGIPTALSYDVVKVGNSYASVFELINAKALTDVIRENPNEISNAVDTYVKLLKQIHSIEDKDDDLPHIKEKALSWKDYLCKELDEKTMNKLQKLLEDIPDSLNIIHGDYHTKNIMIQKGETIMIDMDTLSVGNPIFEFAQIYLSYSAFGEIDHKCVEDFMDMSWDEAQYLLKETVKRYFNIEDPTEYLNKCAVIAYAKLLRRHIKRNQGSEEERTYLKNRIVELVDKLDRLY